MALYRISNSALDPIATVTFLEAQLAERRDLQRMLRERVEVIAPGTLVISEEYARWEDSQRRIDLLGVDREGKLVVMELKVSEGGGHMELQALRYAAMVSAMTFDQAVDALAQHLGAGDHGDDARSMLLNHLQWTEPDDSRFAQEVRIVLVSPEFSREITSTVLWLINSGIDIQCVRFRPHRLNADLIVDVQRIIPLPEAEEYQVRIRQKALQERAAAKADPTVDEMWSRIEATSPPGVHEALREVALRVEELGATWFANRASLSQYVLTPSGRCQFFGIRPEREVNVEIWFRWLAHQPPFNDELLRRELMSRLNRVPGVQIGEDRIAKVPKTEASFLLNRDARERFVGVWAWAIPVAQRALLASEAE